jgi:hypothetical protein
MMSGMAVEAQRYEDVSEGAAVAGLMVVGSAYAGLLSMLWPERAVPAPAAPAPPPTLE